MSSRNWRPEVWWNGRTDWWLGEKDTVSKVIWEAARGILQKRRGIWEEQEDTFGNTGSTYDKTRIYQG